MHHKTRTCPPGFPYYNVSELTCYDQCAVGWYGDPVTMLCKPCLYDCTTCFTATACLTCDATVNFRTFNGSRCPPLPGYYDNNTNNPIANPCTSPCATCVTNDKNCLSCISGYYLSGNKCFPCSIIPNCLSCSSGTFCTLCSTGGSGSTCTVCTANQYLNSALNSCVDCWSAVPFCSTCTSATNCLSCQSTFTLVSPISCTCNATQYLSSTQCLACSSAILNCLSCTSQPACTVCNTSFVSDGSGGCTCDSYSILNSTTNQCDLCSKQYPFCST